MNRRQARRARLAAISVGLLLFGIWTLTPLYWIVVTSIKPDVLISREPTIFPSVVTLDHYSFVLSGTPFLLYLWNSLIVTLATTLAACVAGMLAAYALTRLTFAGRRWVARSVVMAYLVPVSVLFIPLFQVVHALGLLDSLLGLVATYLTFTIPFATWMMISSFRNVPAELEDAAQIDGCSRVQSLFLVMLPAAMPGLAVVALFSFTLSWNEFLYALVFIERDAQKTLMPGLVGLAHGTMSPWGPMMAASLLGALPPVLVYILSQRHGIGVSGVSAGSFRG